MNGTKYLFDTNTLINYFNGVSGLQAFAQKPIIVSIISVIEFLAFSKLTNEHKVLFNQFLKKVEVVDIHSENEALIETIIHIRNSYKLKLPDAIIAATAIYANAPLVTNDGHFKKLDAITTITY